MQKRPYFSTQMLTRTQRNGTPPTCPRIRCKPCKRYQNEPPRTSRRFPSPSDSLDHEAPSFLTHPFYNVGSFRGCLDPRHHRRARRDARQDRDGQLRYPSSDTTLHSCGSYSIAVIISHSYCVSTKLMRGSLVQIWVRAHFLRPLSPARPHGAAQDLGLHRLARIV